MRKYLPFEQALDYVRSLGLKSKYEWELFAKSDSKPANIPMQSHQTYKKSGWIGYSDFLGCEVISKWNRIYRTFEAARIYVRTLNLGSISQWEEWAKTTSRPKDIPKQPDRVY